MAKLINGEVAKVQSGLGFTLGGVATVSKKTRTPAQVKTHFNPNVPAVEGYTPPAEMKSIVGRKRIGLDIEGFDPDLTTLGPGAHRSDGKVVGVAIAYSADKATYYPTEHDTGDNMENPDAFYAQLRDEAKTFDGEMVGANLQYDLDWLRTRHGVIFPKAKFRDVQVAEPLLDENRLTYKLNVLAGDYLNEVKKTDRLEELFGKGYIANMHKVHPSHAGPYAEVDTKLPWMIYDKQAQKLENEGMTDLFEMESALFPLLLEMRYRGVRIDLDKASESHTALKAAQTDIEKRLNDLAGTSVDIWSSDTIAIAFDNLGLEYTRTKTGKASFTKDFLNASNHEIAKLIVQARSNDKIAGTFIKSYILDSHVNGRIHAMFNQLKSDESGTVSGRFSSSSPNLQNIPARDPVLGPLMRSMFIPEEGMLWGSLDWSQIEYRLLVHYAAITRGIDAMEAVRMYRNDPKTDFHTMAAEIAQVDRKSAKGVNFGVVYGMGVPALAANLGITLEEAQEIMGKFQANAPFMKGMLDTASNRAQKNGYIRTILGRRRRWNNYEVRVRNEKGGSDVHYVAEKDIEGFMLKHRGWAKPPRRPSTHKALNALLQGSAADLMKKAMVSMWDAGLFNVLVPHLTVHDEFNSSVPDTKEGHEAFNEMRHIMETALELEIPILADGSLGANWDEAK